MLDYPIKSNSSGLKAAVSYLGAFRQKQDVPQGAGKEIVMLDYRQ
jgi:hypothetical protein